MNQQVISFKLAKLAKNLNICIETPRYYTDKEVLVLHHQESYGESEFYFDCEDFEENWNASNLTMYSNKKRIIPFAAPLQSLLQKYLREEYKVHIAVMPTAQGYWCYQNIPLGELTIGNIMDFINPNSVGDFDSYEEALEEGMLDFLTKLNDNNE